MIISASYKTDIPAFYGEWYLNRLRAEFCLMRNSYTGHKTRISLAPTDVDAFIFWTKNIGPFLSALEEVQDRGFPFVIHHTINNFPKKLEFSVLDADQAIDHVSCVADKYGTRVPIWRYDPIVTTSLTPSSFHQENFEYLANKLKGVVDEVVVSFAHAYKKTKSNMDWASKKFGFTWKDPAAEDKKQLLAQLVKTASSCGMKLTICTQPEFMVDGARPARCVDIIRLSAVANKPILVPEKGNRPGCLCAESRDIGDYDTCPHGCVYCYAVNNRNVAQERYQKHDPSSPLLFGKE